VALDAFAVGIAPAGDRIRVFPKLDNRPLNAIVPQDEPLRKPLSLKSLRFFRSPIRAQGSRFVSFLTDLSTGRDLNRKGSLTLSCKAAWVMQPVGRIREC